MTIKKKYFKNNTICKVTFCPPIEATKSARSVYLVGDFNNWDQTSTPLRQLRNEQFKVTLDLETGKEYQFRYLIDGKRWENAWHADKYIPSPHAYYDNSVVVV